MGSKIHPLRIVEMLAICHCKPIVYVQKQKLSSVMKQVNFYENLKLLGVDFLDLMRKLAYFGCSYLKVKESGKISRIYQTAGKHGIRRYFLQQLLLLSKVVGKFFVMIRYRMTQERQESNKYSVN